ncbi:MAG: hypothetical protein ABI663_12095 [Chryseolinea sp.]
MMKVLGIILLVVGFVSIGISGLCVIAKERFANFESFDETTHRTSLYNSTLAAIVFLGTGTLVLIAEKEDRFISKRK